MDEVVALAIATLWLESKKYSWEVIRTREPAVIDQANMVFDVGRIYDPEKKRFDHHQPDFTLTRPNGIKYASAGLAWKHYGLDLCGGDVDAWNTIDERLIQTFDAFDNGIDLVESIHPSGAMPFNFSSALGAFGPTWQEDPDTEHDAVWSMMELFRSIIPRVITHQTAWQLARTKVLAAYESAADKRIIVLDDNYPWLETIVAKPEPMIVINPRPNGQYSVTGVRVQTGSFETRVSMPQPWRGLEGAELQKVSGFPGAIFCHISGFKAVATDLETAIAMAAAALETASE